MMSSSADLTVSFVSPSSIPPSFLLAPCVSEMHGGASSNHRVARWPSSAINRITELIVG